MSKALTKTQLVEEFMCAGEEGDVSKKAAKAILAYLPELIANQVKKNGVFVLPGVARFIKKTKPARTKPAIKKGTLVRNPATGEMFEHAGRPAQKVPKTTVVKMRVAKALKDGVNG